MKRIILLTIILIITSCSTKEDKIKEIIDNSYYGIYQIKKMSEIKKLKEDIFSLPVHYTMVEKYTEIEKNNEYEITRYIYKTEKGANRMFYLIDFTNNKVIDKSSDFNEFFKPIAIEILGENIGDMEGNNLMELMRY